ncbi:SIMPL domain-containing protein, partial [Actinoalloteichus spitiensis]|uniref:SIMPL domain-containing protein n=1 Tax=Actinoalloteichus spitiensis TaxID=252394 RepID=UPI00037F4712
LVATFAAAGEDRSTAVNELGRRVGDVEAMLRRPGVQVRSRRLSVRANWERNRRVGCRAEQHYQLLVTDTAALEELSSALLAREPESLSGPNWELTSNAEAVREAQHDAVADARRRAEGYAVALGRRLGSLLRISDAEAERAQPRGAYGGAPMAARSGAAPDVRELNLEPQEVTVTARCVTTWSLLD